MLKYKHIGFTGTRWGMTLTQRETLHTILRNLDILSAHHGCCIGADRQFHNLVAACFNLEIFILHPPREIILISAGVFEHVKQIQPAEEYLVRNKNIVNACDLLIAAPCEKKEMNRSGTWSTIRYARDTGKEHIIL